MVIRWKALVEFTPGVGKAACGTNPAAYRKKSSGAGQGFETKTDNLVKDNEKYTQEFWSDPLKGNNEFHHFQQCGAEDNAMERGSKERDKST